MQIKKTIGLTVLGFIMASGAAFADDNGEGKGKHMDRPSFEEIDTNGDGQLTKAELAAVRAAKFAERDTDGNGELSIEEMTADREVKDESRMERKFEFMDKDSSGGISLAEMSPNDDRIEKRFVMMDADENGTISEDEFENGGKRGDCDK